MERTPAAWRRIDAHYDDVLGAKVVNGESDIIKALLKENMMTQKDLAEKLGFKKEKYLNAILGSKHMSAKNFMKLAEGIGVYFVSPPTENRPWVYMLTYDRQHDRLELLMCKTME